MKQKAVVSAHIHELSLIKPLWAGFTEARSSDSAATDNLGGPEHENFCCLSNQCLMACSCSCSEGG